MDYHHPYNVYPEYYCPPYGAAGSGYHSSGSFPHQSHSSGQIHNFNNNPMTQPAQHHHSQQHSHHFLPSYQHQQHPSYNSSSSSSMFVPNFLVSPGTGLTPTLTPTTLANLENSFIELQQSGVRDPVTQSGFVPPVVDTANSADHSQDSYDQSSSDGEWEPREKMPRYGEGIKGIDYIVTSTGTINATPQRKYTRRNKDEKLHPEEEEKRRVRRERNKMAAAKCRQRRVDHTNVLVEETEQLEDEQSKLESEIQKLQQERDQLEFILQAHQPVCKVHMTKVKAEENAPRSSSTYPTPENLSKMSIAPNVVHSSNSSMSLSSVATSRPNSLPLIKRDRARMLSMTSATGVTINTPTSGVSITPSSLFCPGLDSMVDGPTGLTPLTSLSCSSQVNHRSSDSSSENVGSPTLISL